MRIHMRVLDWNIYPIYIYTCIPLEHVFFFYLVWLLFSFRMYVYSDLACQAHFIILSCTMASFVLCILAGSPLHCLGGIDFCFFPRD